MSAVKEQLEVALMLTLIDWIHSRSPTSWKITISVFFDTFFLQQSQYFPRFILLSLLFLFSCISFLSFFLFMVSFFFFFFFFFYFVLRSRVKGPVINFSAKSYSQGSRTLIWSMNRPDRVNRATVNLQINRSLFIWPANHLIDARSASYIFGLTLSLRENIICLFG